MTTPSPTPIELLSGPNRRCDLIFYEFADHILREVGIDVYERKAALKADRQMLVQLLSKSRRERTFADESGLDAIWQEYLRDKGILSDGEQQAKDEYTLAKARTTKDALRESGLSDSARFGYCKRSGCDNRKVERLLLRGFCPDCRGIRVKQTVASGGTFDATKRFSLDATTSEMETSLRVKRKKPHEDTKRSTAEERRMKVLAAKDKNPSATEREIAELTRIPRSTVNHILRTQTVKAQPENTDQVKQFLRNRAEEQQKRKAEAIQYLKNRTKRQRHSQPQAKRRSRKQIYVLAEIGQDQGSKGVEIGQEIITL